MSDDRAVAEGEAATQTPQDTQIAARSQGYSWDDINGYVSDKTEQAKSQGYSQQEIDAHLGYKDPTQRMGAIGGEASALVAAGGEDHTDDFASALRAASGGLFTPGDKTPSMSALDALTASRLHGTPFTSVLGDDKTAPMLSDKPLPPELRAEYANALMNGETKGADDFAQGYTSNVWNAAQDATGAAANSQTAATAMAAASQLAEKLPGAQDLVDQSLVLSKQAPGSEPKEVYKSLLQNWVVNGESPADAFKRAQTDRNFLLELTTPKPPAPPTLDALLQHHMGVLTPTEQLTQMTLDPGFNLVHGFIEGASGQEPEASRNFIDRLRTLPEGVGWIAGKQIRNITDMAQALMDPGFQQRLQLGDISPEERQTVVSAALTILHLRGPVAPVHPDYAGLAPDGIMRNESGSLNLGGREPPVSETKQQIDALAAQRDRNQAAIEATTDPQELTARRNLLENQEARLRVLTEKQAQEEAGPSRGDNLPPGMRTMPLDRQPGDVMPPTSGAPGEIHEMMPPLPPLDPRVMSQESKLVDVNDHALRFDNDLQRRQQQADVDVRYMNRFEKQLAKTNPELFDPAFSEKWLHALEKQDVDGTPYPDDVQKAMDNPNVRSFLYTQYARAKDHELFMAKADGVEPAKWATEPWNPNRVSRTIFPDRPDLPSIGHNALDPTDLSIPNLPTYKQPVRGAQVSGANLRTRPRQWMVAEAENLEGEGITRKVIHTDEPPGTKVEKEGEQPYTVKEATIKEIEEHRDENGEPIPIEYRKNVIQNTRDNILQTGRMDRSARTLDANLQLWKEKDLFVPDEVAKDGVENWQQLSDHPPTFTNDKGVEEAMVHVDYPMGIKGWVPEHLALELERYAGPAARNNLYTWVEAVNRAIGRVYFALPIVHGANMGVDWAYGRGLIGNMNVYRLVRHGAEAMYQVAARPPGGIYEQLQNLGISLHFSQVLDANIVKMMGEQATRTVASAPGAASLAARFGMKPLQLAARVYKIVSSNATWFTGDLFLVQRAAELHGQGMSLEAAGRQAEREIASYKIPTKVMGSPELSQLWTDRALTFFGNYDYNRLEIFGNVAHDAFGKHPDMSWADALRTRGHGFDQALMLGLGAVYFGPMLTSAFRQATGNPNATLPAYGQALIPSAIAALESGDVGRFIGSFMHLSPVLNTAIDVHQNANAFGKPVLNGHKDWAGQVADAVRFAANSLPTSSAALGAVGDEHGRGSLANATARIAVGGSLPDEGQPGRVARYKISQDRYAAKLDLTDPVRAGVLKLWHLVTSSVAGAAEPGSTPPGVPPPESEDDIKKREAAEDAAIKTARQALPPVPTTDTHGVQVLHGGQPTGGIDNSYSYKLGDYTYTVHGGLTAPPVEQNGVMVFKGGLSPNVGGAIPDDATIKQTATSLNPAAAKFTIGQQYAMIQDQQRQTAAKATLAENRSFTAGLTKDRQDFDDKQLADRRANDKILRAEQAASADPNSKEIQIKKEQDYADMQKEAKRQQELVWDAKRQEHADDVKERDLRFQEAQRVQRDALEAREREAKLKAEQLAAANQPARAPRFTKKQQAALDAIENE